MSAVCVDLSKMNLDTSTEEGEFNNLILNMMGGLEYDHLSDHEKTLLAKNGYDPRTSAE